MKSTKSVLMQIARENNTTLQEVEREIQKSIDMAMADPDPEVRERWKRIFGDGYRPSPEEFIDKLVKNIKKML